MVAPTTLKDTHVKRFSPTGASDSLDATDEFPGACSSLANLVPDLTTRNLWTCRPAATKLIDFSTCPSLPGGNTPGGVQVFKIFGNFVYGLYEDVTAGVDRPFGYNLVTNSFITITNTGTNPPTAASNTSWVPPTIDLVGDSLIITHPNYTVSPLNPVGFINDLSSGIPTYITGDLSGAITFSSLGTIPTWVCQFNQRCYYGVNVPTKPAVIASDVLNCSQVTNAGQILTFGDNLILTAASGLPLSNQLGGIIQALMVFKGSSNIEQITGDYALSNWTVNSLNVATGTLAPRSIVSTPLGLAFLSPDGMRIIDQDATVSDPIGYAGKGIAVPFNHANLSIPTRACAGCDGVNIVFAVFTGASSGFEYWFNLARKVWSGPHTPFVAGQFGVYQGEILASGCPGIAEGLYSCPTDPVSNSTFTELSTALTFTMQSASLEDNQQMAASEVAEAQVVGAAASSLTATVNFVDSNANVINTANVTFTTAGLQAYHVDFPAISVFNRIAIQITGNSAAGVRIGDSFLRLRTLSYLPPPPPP